VRNLNLSTAAAGFLTALEAKQVGQVWNKIVALMKDPRPNDSIDLGKVFFRTSVGEYRIAYKFDKITLHVDLIAKRNDDEIYKRLKRRQ
jgi:mRNA interferase RelE/StbE